MLKADAWFGIKELIRTDRIRIKRIKYIGFLQDSDIYNPPFVRKSKNIGLQQTILILSYQKAYVNKFHIIITIY